MRLLATDVAPTTRTRITLINRFSDLEQEEQEDQQAPMTAGQVTSSPTVSQAAHVSNAMTDGEHDLLLVQGKINGRRATMLIDSGSMHDFISEDFVKRHSLAATSGPDDIRVTLVDGSTTSRQIVTTGDVKVVVKDFSETQHFTVIPLFPYDTILGKPWLFRNNSNIDLHTNTVVLGQEHISARFDELSGAANDSRLVESMFISGRQARHALRSGAKGYLAWVTDDEGVGTSPTDQVLSQLPADMRDLLKQYDNIFPSELPNHLPPKTPVDHAIKVEEEAQPSSRPAYHLSKPEMNELQVQLSEMNELQVQLSEMLKHGFIEPSRSPYGAPVFFVKKTDGSLCMVCD